MEDLEIGDLVKVVDSSGFGVFFERGYIHPSSGKRYSTNYYWVAFLDPTQETVGFPRNYLEKV